MDEPHSSGVALGAYVEGYPSDRLALDRYAALAGRRPAIVHIFRNWTDATRDFDPALAAEIAGAGATPMISWQPWDGLAPINRGEWDGYIGSYARAVAGWGGPLLLRFAHEMNGRWIAWGESPAAYRAAWLRVHAAFEEAGAGNVAWVWSPHVCERRARPFEDYYPGHDAVDWVALDGYNWGRSQRFSTWRRFEPTFVASYLGLQALAPSKPVMLAEIGCAEEGGDKAAWILDALGRAIPQAMSAVRAVVWFNANVNGHANWRVDSSPQALGAWRAVVADPRYAAGAPTIRLRGK